MTQDHGGPTSDAASGRGRRFGEQAKGLSLRDVALILGARPARLRLDDTLVSPRAPSCEQDQGAEEDDDEASGYDASTKIGEDRVPHGGDHATVVATGTAALGIQPHAAQAAGVGASGERRRG